MNLVLPLQSAMQRDWKLSNAQTETKNTGNRCYELTIVAVSGRIAPPGLRK
jgi:hypothetical protein